MRTMGDRKRHSAVQDYALGRQFKGLSSLVSIFLRLCHDQLTPERGVDVLVSHQGTGGKVVDPNLRRGRSAGVSRQG